MLIGVLVGTITSRSAAQSADSTKTETLEHTIEYNAADSMQFSVDAKQVKLYGNAKVVYGSITVEAAYIEFNLDKKELFAASITDTNDSIIGKPQFTEGDQSFTASTMRYNFDSKNGKITKAITQQGDGYIHGGQIKTLENNQVFFIKNGRYTTCDKPDKPHFYIEAKKLKVIQKKAIVTGPANMKIFNIPTPLVAPFGYFPTDMNKSSGFVMPQIGQSPAMGLFLTDGGWFFNINDFLSAELLGSIYSRGSWGAQTRLNYKKRYKYNGNFSYEYNYNRIGLGEQDPNFIKNSQYFVRWRHTQDSKAHPKNRFSGDVNFGSSNNFTNKVNANVNDILTNTFKSNVQFSTSFLNRKVNLSMSANHVQNSRDSSVVVNFPEVALNVSRFFITNKNRVGPKKWYENIGFTYNFNTRNSFKDQGAIVLNEINSNQFSSGAKHDFTASTSLKMRKTFLQYFTLTPNFTYSDKWTMQSIRKTFDEDTRTVITDTIQGFERFGDYSFNAALTTKIYGMYQFRSKKIKAIRHVITPSVNFSWKPDLTKESLGYFQTVALDTNGRTSQYSIFDQALYGRPSTASNGILTWQLMNNLEMKVVSKKDSTTTTKKIKLLEGLSFRGTYNFFADSMRFSTIPLSGWTSFKDGKINLRFNGTLDPYAIQGGNVKVAIPQYQATNNYLRLVRLTTFTTNLAVSLKSSTQKPPRATQNLNPLEIQEVDEQPEYFVDFNIPWNLRLNYTFKYTQNFYRDSRSFVNTVDLAGDVRIAKSWKIAFRTSYDFVEKDLGITSIDIHKDLHCWEAKLNVIPFGPNRRYMFDINVKSPTLSAIKFSRKRNLYDL